MPRFSQWELTRADAEPKRSRLYGELDDYGNDGYVGLDCTQPPDSPELPVAEPEPTQSQMPVALTHELSQRVVLSTVASTTPVYDEILGRLARLSRLDDASVGKLLTKDELICLLASNAIPLSRDHRKATIVAQLLKALKENQVAPSLAEAHRRLAPDEETLPPEDYGASLAADPAPDLAESLAPPPRAPPAATAPPRTSAAVATPAVGGAVVRAAEVPATTPLVEHRGAPSRPHRAPLPPASLTPDEASFVWKLLTHTLGEPVADSDGSAREPRRGAATAMRSVHTQTEGTASRADSAAREPPAQQWDQLQQSQACIVSSQLPSRDVDDLVPKVRRLLKLAPALVSDGEIKDGLAAHNYHVLRTVEFLRAASARARTGVVEMTARQRSSDGTKRDDGPLTVRAWEERLAWGAL